MTEATLVPSLETWPRHLLAGQPWTKLYALLRLSASSGEQMEKHGPAQAAGGSEGSAEACRGTLISRTDRSASRSTTVRGRAGFKRGGPLVYTSSLKTAEESGAGRWRKERVWGALEATVQQTPFHFSRHSGDLRCTHSQLRHAPTPALHCRTLARERRPGEGARQGS